MANLPNIFSAGPCAIEAVAAAIDEFIDKLQLTWATNAPNGVTLRPGSRLAREIELSLIRTIGATVAPEAIFARLGVELNRFVHQVDRLANPLFHDILLCCHRLMEVWNEMGMFENVQSIEGSLQDAAELEQRRRVVRYGQTSPRDIQRIERMEQTMIADHRMRMQIDAYIRGLEDTISNIPVEDDNNDDVGIEGDEMSDEDVEMGDRNTENAA